MGIGRHVVIHDVIHDDNEMGNRPISYQDVALQIFYASIFYPFANFRKLANCCKNIWHCQTVGKHLLSRVEADREDRTLAGAGIQLHDRR